jgi:hypothetical protein
MNRSLLKQPPRTRVRQIIILGAVLWLTNQTSADVNLQFSASNYGLEGDVAGDASISLTDSSTGVSGFITTRHLSPAESHLHINGGLFGLENHPSQADNAFDFQEAWTFDWNVPVILGAIQFSRAFLFDHILLMRVESPGWRGISLVGNPGNATFDPTVGSFTFTLSNAPTGAIMIFPDLTSTGPLVLSPGTDITIRNLSQSPTAVRAMNFLLVPEPASVCLIGLGQLLLWRKLRRHVSHADVETRAPWFVPKRCREGKMD